MVRQRTNMLPFLFAFKYTWDVFLVCWIMKINNHWQGISILIQLKFYLNSIKLFIQNGIQLNLMSIWLKSMKIQLEFDWIRIEIQLIGIAFNSIQFQLIGFKSNELIGFNLIQLFGSIPIWIEIWLNLNWNPIGWNSISNPI
jgi:hypothetical protein